MRNFFIVAAAISASGCAVLDLIEGEPDEITIAYDPSSEGTTDADARAQDHCAGFAKSAVYVDETLDGDGRMRRRHYHCR